MTAASIDPATEVEGHWYRLLDRLGPTWREWNDTSFAHAVTMVLLVVARVVAAVVIALGMVAYIAYRAVFRWWINRRKQRHAPRRRRR